MKNQLNNLLDEVTPTTDEHRDVLSTFLGFPVILFAIIGALYCILKFMR
jgi:hypothetical protein